MDKGERCDAAEFCEVISDGEQERKEDKRKEAIPKLSPMTEKTDLLEYLEMFEEHMHQKKIGWCGHLMPLLNDECRPAATHLEPDEREVYDALKEELIGTSSDNARRAGEAFQMLERERKQTFPRLANRFATGETIREAVDKVSFGETRSDATKAGNH